MLPNMSAPIIFSTTTADTFAKGDGWMQPAANGPTGSPGAKRPAIGSALFSTILSGTSVYGTPGSWASQRVNQVMHFRHWSYIGIRCIMQHVGGLVPNIGWVQADAELHRQQRKSYTGARRHRLHDSYLRSLRTRKSLGAIRPHEEVEMVGVNHPLPRLLECPNELDTQGDLYAELTLFLKLCGEAFLWVVPSKLPGRDGRGLPCELWVIPSHWVRPKIERGQLPAHYEIYPWLGGGGSFKMPADEIIHLRYKNPIHKFMGLSPQTAGSEWIDVSESIDISRFWSFKNGCFPLGALELAEGYDEPDDAELERLYAKFFSRIRGESRFGSPIITPPGAKYNPIMIAPTEMAYGESAEQMARWVLALWGVPIELAGIQEAGSERAMYGPEQMFCKHTLDPDLRQLGAWLTRSLASRWDERLRVWFDSTVQEDPQEVRSNLQLAAANASVTPNEIRTILLHLEPYARGGDNPLVRTGLTPVPFNAPVDEEIKEALAPPQKPGAGGPGGDMAALLGGGKPGEKPPGPEKMADGTPEDEPEPDGFGRPPKKPTEAEEGKAFLEGLQKSFQPGNRLAQLNGMGRNGHAH